MTVHVDGRALRCICKSVNLGYENLLSHEIHCGDCGGWFQLDNLMSHPINRQLRPAARTTDPATSQHTATLNFAGRRKQILEALRRAGRPLDAHELADWINAQPNYKPTVPGHAGKRAGELVAAGALYVAGTHLSPDGHPVTVWDLTPAYRKQAA